MAPRSRSDSRGDSRGPRAPLPPGAPETGVADSRGNLVKPARDERSCRHKIFQVLFELPARDPRYLGRSGKNAWKIILPVSLASGILGPPSPSPNPLAKQTPRGPVSRLTESPGRVSTLHYDVSIQSPSSTIHTFQTLFQTSPCRLEGLALSPCTFSCSGNITHPRCLAPLAGTITAGQKGTTG